MRTALITGITGQDGSYLAELLLAKGYRVVGIVRRSSTTVPERLQHIVGQVELRTADLLDQESLAAVVREVDPSEVYNLAATSFVHSSWHQPAMTGEYTALGATRVLEAVRQYAPAARVYQAGSSEMFGRPVEVPQRETTPFHPRSPYGTAKVYAHWMVANYRDHFGLYATSGILYNHESPRRGLEFVTRKVTDAVAHIHLGLAQQVALGSLHARRDWGYAGDYVRAMWMMLQRETPEDFVIGTGETRSVGELCEVAFRTVGLDYREHVVEDPRFVRQPERPEHQLVADPSRAHERLGWRPTVTFEEMIQEMVRADVERLRAAGDPSIAMER
jgi:GDPmannose 4,6-dehydratase